MRRPAQLDSTVLMGVLLLHGVVRAQATTVMKPLLNQVAPQLMVAEWMNTPNPITAKDLRGKVVLLEFWATW